MPEFVRPRRAIIETGGGSEWAGLLIVLAVVVSVVASLVMFVMAHAVLVSCCLSAAGVVLGSFLVWCRWISSPKRLLRAGVMPSQQAGIVRQPAASACALPEATSVRALPSAQHLHLHFHGVTPEDAAAITQASRRDAR